MPVDSLSTSAGLPLPDQYQLLMPAWGAKYIRVFLDYTLPSHLAPGNIDALPRASTVLRIFTRTPDIDVFRSSALFRRYEAEHAVAFESIDDLQLVKENPYQTLTACHERALKDAAGTDTAFFFLNPDAVYGDGTYAAILKRLAEGKRAVLTHGLRASLPAFAADLDALRPAPAAWPALPPRQVARLVLDNLHPVSRAHLMTGAGNRSVGSYYWPVGRDGLVCRCTHTHPLAVRPLHPITRLWTTIDHEYVRMSCPDPLTVHLVTDSDELIAIELSEPDHLAEWVKAENIPAEDILAWMADWTNGYHREAFRRTVVFHAEPVTAEYGAIERTAEAYASGLLAEFARRHPAAGPDMACVTRAIEVEAQAAARAAAEAAARTATPVPPPPPPTPSLFSRVRGKFHRLLNRRLYDRYDQLVNVTRTLSEQRLLDEDRTRRAADELAQRTGTLQQQVDLLLQQTAELRAQAADTHVRLSQMRFTHDRLLTLLSRTGVISFSDRDPARPTSQPPPGYSDYDMASMVYRPAFERAIRYLQGNDLPGCVAEFGTFRGFTAQTFAELLRDIQWPADLYLYDSFEGLPPPTGNDVTSYEVVRRKSWLEGQMAPEPDIVARIRESLVKAIGAERLYIHPGFFDASLPAHPPRQRVAILHIDSDFYESCRFVLQHLADADLLTDGGVLLMDDFNSNAANPNMGERKALTDFLAANPKWVASPWFTYGWSGHAFFLHDTTVVGT